MRPKVWANRRAFERIDYAGRGDAVERPQFLVGGEVLNVLDCSERGLRCTVPSASVPQVSDDIRGRVRFPPAPPSPRGVEVYVDGVVTRVHEDSLGVQFTAVWIPREVILAERRRSGLLPGQEHDERRSDARE